MNALRRRKELSDICDVELQLREEVKILGNLEISRIIMLVFRLCFIFFLFRRLREDNEKLPTVWPDLKKNGKKNIGVMVVVLTSSPGVEMGKRTVIRINLVSFLIIKNITLL